MFLAACGDSVTQRANQLQTVTFTAAGVAVRAETGVAVTPEAKAAIDAGLGDTIDKAKCLKYTKGLNRNGYSVAILIGQPDSAGNPALRIGCGNYCGTEWDKGGYMLIAGEVVTLSGVQTIIVPEHTSNYENLRRVIGYEAEHIILRLNDPDEYDRTKVHGTGQGHPIIPPCKISQSELHNANKYTQKASFGTIGTDF